MQWVTVFGSTVSAPIRKRGPKYLERYADPVLPMYRIREYEYRAGAWYVVGTRPARPWIIADALGLAAYPDPIHDGPPRGIIVSQAGPHQVEVSHRMGRAYIAADAEGYSR
jgi:hypothetical protein